MNVIDIKRDTHIHIFIVFLSFMSAVYYFYHRPVCQPKSNDSVPTANDKYNMFSCLSTVPRALCEYHYNG